MRFFRFLLLPFSLIYGLAVSVRNFLFDKGILKSKKYAFPVISVGNISAGGTGKTPHSEYLISLLKANYSLALLSRGYRRKTKGFLLANAHSNAATIGDEPFQVAQKFPEISVAVCEKRVEGIEKLQNLPSPPQIILLDDAFQHRYVQAGFSVLLTNYNSLWYNDLLLPAGRLREPSCGSKRADVVIVTKCPRALPESEKQEMRQKLKLKSAQKLYFTTYRYAKPKALFGEKSLEMNEKTSLLLVTGIVSVGELEAHLQQFTQKITSINFPDHHFFNENDLAKIAVEFEKLPAENRAIIVTEKDAARLKTIAEKLPNSLKNNLFSVGIEVEFLSDGNEFDRQIVDFVEKF